MIFLSMGIHWYYQTIGISLSSSSSFSPWHFRVILILTWQSISQSDLYDITFKDINLIRLIISLLLQLEMSKSRNCDRKRKSSERKVHIFQVLMIDIFCFFFRFHFFSSELQSELFLLAIQFSTLPIQLVQFLIC